LLLQLEGFSLEDIASISGSSAETVKSRLRYARASLSQALELFHDHHK
jgi:DNA-directed RNA polymerase specialized sigma24 family protein